MTLAVNVATEDEAAAQAAGATVLKGAEQLRWAVSAGYVARPDAHVGVVCATPHVPIDPDGRMHLPA